MVTHRQEMQCDKCKRNFRDHYNLQRHQCPFAQEYDSIEDYNPFLDIEMPDAAFHDVNPVDGADLPDHHADNPDCVSRNLDQAAAELDLDFAENTAGDADDNLMERADTDDNSSQVQIFKSTI